MPSRRHHAKTTTGCFACKARRVKVRISSCLQHISYLTVTRQCDEARPACKSCARRQTKCQYPYDEDGQATSPQQSSQQGRSPSVHEQTTFPISPVFDALDLRLMHRYCTNTSVHLLPSPEATQVWQMVVPQKAETHLILHHAILALAAADLAASHASEDATLTATFRARGLYHQQVALPMFQTMLQHQSQDPSSSNVIFLFSIVLIILAFGNLQSTSEPPTVEDVLQVFALFRGPRTLWNIRDTSEESMTEVIFSGEKLTMSTSPPSSDHLFVALDQEDLDEVCTEAANLLKQSWATVQSLPNDVRAMAYFPAMADEAFFIKVANHERNALLVLRHYAIILKAHEPRWWVGRWSRILVAAIDAVY